MLDKLRKWNAALAAPGYRLLLGWTFFLQTVFMVGIWPPDPPPALPPPPEQSYDLSLLLDPPPPATPMAPTPCRPTDILFDRPCGIPVLR